MSSNVRSFADFELRGSLVFGNNLTDFPVNPRQGQTNLINGVVWVYTTIDGINTWYPLTNKKNSYVHTQAVAAFQWTVTHGLGTQDVLYSVYDENGAPQIATITFINDNSFRLNFTSAVTGRCVVFADSERFSSTIDAGILNAASVSVAGGVVTADNTGLKVNGQSVATLLDGVLNPTQIPTVPFAKISDVPTTIGGLGLTDAYTIAQTDALLAGKASAGGSSSVDFTANGLTVSGDILPAVAGVSKIGSPTQKFAAVYTKDMYIDASTLYIDGIPVFGSAGNSINFTADNSQDIHITTSGTGATVLESQSSILIQGTGVNTDVNISATGEARLTAPIVTADGDMVVTGNGSVSGNLTVVGNLIIAGSQTQVDSTVVTVADNIVVYNNGEVGAGVTNRFAGIQIDRGTLADVRFVYDESDDKWKVGEAGSETALALVTDLSGLAVASTVYTKTESDNRYLSAGITIDGGVL